MNLVLVTYALGKQIIFGRVSNLKGTILIDVQQYMTGVSLLEGGELKEHYVEYRDEVSLTGDVYCGKVVNVVKGLQSAFVDIGRDRNGFLSVEETMDHKSVLQNAISKEIQAKSGDYILVQVTKEEIGTKGARLTTNISLAGRYVVYLPTLSFVGVSNKITDEKVREKLTALLNKHVDGENGLIARTICLESKKSEIIAEIKQLKNLWDSILKNFKNKKSICKIYDDGDIVFRTVRDILSDNIDEVVCNDVLECEHLREKVRAFNPKYESKIKYYDESIDMYTKYGILNEVDKLLDKKVKLPSGGSIVFDYTEALTVIDVNTAKYKGNVDHEDTVFNTNIEAATEIARQIRLRNIGGIIIIDFIDMINEDNKAKVIQRLRDEMIFDRTKTRIAGMTNLGLVEVTRKKTGRELSTVLLDKCPHCNGDALTYSNDYTCRKIKADLCSLFALEQISCVSIKVHESLAEHIECSKYFDSVCTNEWADKRIYLIKSKHMESSEYQIKQHKNGDDLPENAILLC